MIMFAAAPFFYKPACVERLCNLVLDCGVNRRLKTHAWSPWAVAAQTVNRP